MMTHKAYRPTEMGVAEPRTPPILFMNNNLNCLNVTPCIIFHLCVLVLQKLLMHNSLSKIYNSIQCSVVFYLLTLLSSRGWSKADEDPPAKYFPTS